MAESKTVQHRAVKNGWPHDDYGNPFLVDTNGAGSGVCTCGWVSLAYLSGTERRAAIARHAARVARDA